MRRLERRQLFICILVGFLVYGLICYELLPTITEPIQGEPYSYILSEKITLHDSKSYPVPLSLWHVNQNDIALAEGITVVISNRVSTKSTGSARNASCSRSQNTDSEDILPDLIDCPDTAFKLAKVQACQYLDIPPPRAPALL
jgi:hypothetical protein